MLKANANIYVMPIYRTEEITSKVVDTFQCFDGCIVGVSGEMLPEFKELGIWPYGKTYIGQNVADVTFYRLNLL